MLRSVESPRLVVFRLTLVFWPSTSGKRAANICKRGIISPTPVKHIELDRYQRNRPQKSYLHVQRPSLVFDPPISDESTIGTNRMHEYHPCSNAVLALSW